MQLVLTPTIIGETDPEKIRGWLREIDGCTSEEWQWVMEVLHPPDDSELNF